VGKQILENIKNPVEMGDFFWGMFGERKAFTEIQVSVLHFLYCLSRQVMEILFHCKGQEIDIGNDGDIKFINHTGLETYLFRNSVL
jgi:hypothetical protein